MFDWCYAERILHMDLTTGTSRTEPTSLALKREYVGGAGFVARLLREDGGAAAGSRVVLAAGPLSDGLAGRLAMGASMGAGRGVALSSIGGRMAAALKSSGYDALVISGQLSEPACLVIGHGGATLESAGDLWGRDVPATEAVLTGVLGSEYASMVVGPAAENQVPFATLAHEGHYAGGSGVAATLGGQRLKAVLVRDGGGIRPRCSGCTMACPGQLAPEARRASELGLDAPTAARMAALAARCASEGLLPAEGEPLEAMARREGIGALLAAGESEVLARLGPAAERLAADLPRPKRRGGPGVADLLGTCQRLFRDRPGGVLREALSSTVGLLAGGMA